MSEDLLDYWIRIIKPLFPENAWIASRLSGGNHFIQIDWSCHNDPDQPNKRSRMIEITIKEAVIDDYLDRDKNGRSLSDSNMLQWISEQYHQFKLDDDTRTYKPATPAVWHITKAVLHP